MDEGRHLIVGGAGYFGARLAEALSQKADVVITQRRSSAERQAWIERTGINVVEFDSSRTTILPVDGCFETVINLAMPGAAEAARSPDSCHKQAAATTSACLRMLDEGRARRVLHFSTFHVYGSSGRTRYDENDVPAPSHPYGHSHLECERQMLAHAHTLVIRPTNMVGAPAHGDLGEQAKLLILDLARQAAAGSMTLHNDGASYRDFLPFDDAIDAVKLLLRSEIKGERLFNLACGRAQRLDGVARAIQEAAGNHPTLKFGSGSDAFRQPFFVNTERLQRLGWQPRASLAAEARRIVGFFA